LANTSANELLAQCLTGQWDPELVERLLDDRDLFRVVVEGLADRFEPALCDTYADLFSHVIERSLGVPAAALRERYERIRKPRTCTKNPEIVFVLSRVTLGADIAVTSVLLDAVKRKFPDARIYFCGSQKAYELFEADKRVEWLEAPYRRDGSLEDRLAARPDLRHPRAIVVDPDSRLTQLGLLPVCEEENYFFFESRAYGAETEEPLSRLAARWAWEVFDVPDAKAYLAPVSMKQPKPQITVSLGVGENPAKRVGGEFERDLVATLAEREMYLLVDKGAGAEEAERAQAAVAGLPPHVRLWDGAFAPFADAIQQSALYVGYDSAGQHVAAAAGTPFLSVFAGAVNARFAQRWRPAGPGRGVVVPADGAYGTEVLAAVRNSLKSLE
jgi:hypothetical protein